MLSIELFDVGNGDFIYIKIDDNESVHIIVDLGRKNAKSYGEVKKLFENINSNEQIYLFITHIDDDHIGGLYRMLESEEDINLLEKLSKIFINNAKVEEESSLHSINTAIDVLSKLENTSISQEKCVVYGKKYDLKKGEIKIKIVTPTIEDRKYIAENLIKEEIDNRHNSNNDKEVDINNAIIKEELLEKDNSLTNKASISFSMEYSGKKFLFLGDAHIDIVYDNLNKIYWSEIANNGYIDFEVIKLSHHGSYRNINREFMKLVKCNNYLLTSKSGIYKKTLKVMLDEQNKVNIYCSNLEWDKYFFTKNDIEEYFHKHKLVIKEGRYISERLYSQTNGGK